MEFNPFDDDVRLQGFRLATSTRAAGPARATPWCPSTSFCNRCRSTISRSSWIGRRCGAPRQRSTWRRIRVASASTTSIRGNTELMFLGEPVDAVVPAIVDQATASTATDGVVTLEVGNQRHAAGARRRGRVPAFPTLAARFVIVDQVVMSAILDRIQPGMGAPTEMWLGADTANARQQLRTAVESGEFETVDLADRSEIEAQIAGEHARTVGDVRVGRRRWRRRCLAPSP